MENQEFPSNTRAIRSSLARETNEPLEKAPVKKIEKLTTGVVKTKKPSLGRRLTESFLEDTTKSVGSYIVHDVLIPAAKSMVCDIVGWGGFAEMLLFGGIGGGRRTSRVGNRSVVNYNSISSGGIRGVDRGGNRSISAGARARHDFQEVVLETRGEAEEVLSNLVDLTIDYSQATVADLYGYVGIQSTPADVAWGWRDLKSASVNRVKDGYLIVLPRPIPLDV